MATQQTTASPINGIDFTTYLVKNLERAISFYRDTLGLTVTKSFGSDFAEFTFADGTTLALDKQEGWLEGNVVNFGVSDIRFAVDLYKERGVKFHNDGEVFETAVCFVALARDSEGNSFMLHQRK